jgi:mannose-6-phosphate isomerase-like protein (cupin superfamily)
MSSVSPIPHTFDPLALIDFTRLYAAEVAAGQFPYIEYDERERWHQRIYRDRRVDVWLISWMPSQGTSLHDHGGSSGAFSVVEGELTETVDATAVGARHPDRQPLREITRATGDTVGFGPSYIHDVRNVGTAPAVSVHAYSPPLTSMTYYDLDDRALRPIVTVQTDDPEHELSAADLRAAS